MSCEEGIAGSKRFGFGICIEIDASAITIDNVTKGAKDQGNVMKNNDNVSITSYHPVKRLQ